MTLTGKLGTYSSTLGNVQLGESDVLYLTTSMLGNSSVTPGWTRTQPLGASLLGGSSQTSYFVESLALASSMGGDSSLSPGWTRTQPLVASLLGDSSLSPGWTRTQPLESSMSGSSSFNSSAWVSIVLGSFLGGESGFTSFIVWKAHREGMGHPTYNSALTLQQFIDALVPSRAALKVVPTHSSIVDTNPKKRRVLR